jgi:hypothetical protein
MIGLDQGDGMMKLAGIGLAVLALASGIMAAGYWYRSSKLQITPAWGSGSQGELFQPLDSEDAQQGWIVGMLETSSVSADMNAKAAIWTAVSVVIGAISSIVSAL